MIVMKFGGTSVQDAAALRRAAGLIFCARERAPLVVVSACAGVTEALLQLPAHQNLENALAALHDLRRRHLNLAREIYFEDLVRNQCATIPAHGDSSHLQFWRMMRRRVNVDCRGLLLLLRQIYAGRSLTPRLRDCFAACGERWSSLLLTLALRQRGLPVRLVDSRRVLVTDAAFTEAKPHLALTRARVRQKLLPLLHPGETVVTQGFVGATANGATTTLGRGGSDYSAAIFGAALDAEEIQIWKDVDGILTADPRLVSHARPVHALTFNEAAELAFLGVKALHPRAMLPALEKNIPVRVLNSCEPAHSGTLITRTANAHALHGVQSISCKAHIAVIHVQRARALQSPAFLAQVFAACEAQHHTIYALALLQSGVALAVAEQQQQQVVRSLRTAARLRATPGRALVSLVGERAFWREDLIARIFCRLAQEKITVELFSLGHGAASISLVVAEQHAQAAVQSLHAELFALASVRPRFENPKPVGSTNGARAKYVAC